MDLIYKVYSILLYDNQLNVDYIILYNRTKRINSYDITIPTPYSNALNRIFTETPNKDKDRSLIYMQKAYNECKNKSLFIKNNGYFTFVKNNVALHPRHINEKYSSYDAYWNETKSGVNIFDYEVLANWNLGSSQYSSHEIWEYKSERSKKLRDYNLDLLL